MGYTVSTSVSHPARGEWIEIYKPFLRPPRRRSLIPRGVSGLKLVMARFPPLAQNRSHPARGEWIEISRNCATLMPMRSHPARGEWIEMRHPHSSQLHWLRLTPRGVSGLKSQLPNTNPTKAMSHPTRGEWIKVTRSTTAPDSFMARSRRRLSRSAMTTLPRKISA